MKYRIDGTLMLPAYRLVLKLRGKPVTQPRTRAYLAITPTYRSYN